MANDGISRRDFFTYLTGAAALALGGCATSNPGQDSVTITVPDRSVVPLPYTGAEPEGTILISYSHRQLYLVDADGKVRAYTIAVPRPGLEGPFPWAPGGYQHTIITHELANPPWTPTPNMLRENPGLRAYAGGEPGNPMGSYALYFRDGDFYRIHGSSSDISIGEAVSAGCIRMTNAQVEDLAARVGPNTVVKFYQGDIPGITARGPRMEQRQIPVLNRI